MKNWLFIFFVFIPFFAFSQKAVKGKFYSERAEPIEFANVLLYKKADTLTILEGVITDNLGVFQFENIEEGEYLLKIHGIGYQPKGILIQKTQMQDKDLGVIILSNDAIQLESVTITAKKELVEQTNTGFIVNSDATLTQQGGTAIDLLRNTPTVFVDAEGGVSLRGKTPLILINGRISKLDNLNAIAASSIEKIEVITTPGANYDAEAENGMINIILKKNKSEGLNGAFSIGSGMGASWRFNSSALLNYKKGGWNYGLSYDNRLAERTRKAKGDRVNFNLPDQYFLTQRRNDDRNEGIHNLRSTIDYSNDKSLFGAEFIFTNENEHNFEDLYSIFENQSREFISKNNRFSDEKRNVNAGEAAFIYERKLQKEGQKFSVNTSLSFTDGIELTNIRTQNLLADNQPIENPFLQQTSFKDKSIIGNFRTDYTQKTSLGIFETGYRMLLRDFKNDFSRADQINGIFTIVPNFTGVMNFEEHVHAVYGQHKFDKIGNWYGEAGLRLEHTNNHGNVESINVEFKNAYTNLFPTLHIGYDIDEKQSISFNFGKRINRPTFGQLNPFTDITDSLTQRSGNPQLLPEISHNAEFSFFRYFEKGSVISKIYYRESKNSILPFTILKPNGVLFTRPENAGRTTTTGIEMILSYEPFHFWKTNLSFSLFNLNINAENLQAEALNTVLSWNTKWINDFALSKNTILQIIGIYNSPIATIQGNRIAVYNVDLAFQQKLWKDKARIGVIITDVFDTQESGFIWNTNDFDFSRIFKVDTRAFLITFAYTFKSTFKEKLMENKFSNN